MLPLQPYQAYQTLTSTVFFSLGISSNGYLKIFYESIAIIIFKPILEYAPLTEYLLYT